MTDPAESIRLLVEQGKQQIDQFTRESQESFAALSSSARDEFIGGLNDFLNNELSAFRREINNLSRSPTLSRIFGNSSFGQSAGTFLSSLLSGILQLRGQDNSPSSPSPSTPSMNFSRGQTSAQAVTELSRGQRNL